MWITENKKITERYGNLKFYRINSRKSRYSAGRTGKCVQWCAGAVFPVYVGDSSYEEHLSEDAVNVTVGVFFDGTWNNRNNTDTRLEHEKRQQNQPFDASLADKYIAGENSFENYHSNVARLEPFYEIINEEKQKQLAIYIEGIGTEDYEKDTTFGGDSEREAQEFVLRSIKPVKRS